MNVLLGYAICVAIALAINLLVRKEIVMDPALTLHQAIDNGHRMIPDRTFGTDRTAYYCRDCKGVWRNDWRGRAACWAVRLEEKCETE